MTKHPRFKRLSNSRPSISNEVRAEMISIGVTEDLSNGSGEDFWRWKTIAEWRVKNSKLKNVALKGPGLRYFERLRPDEPGLLASLERMQRKADMIRGNGLEIQMLTLTHEQKWADVDADQVMKNFKTHRFDPNAECDFSEDN